MNDGDVIAIVVYFFIEWFVAYKKITYLIINNKNIFSDGLIPNLLQFKYVHKNCNIMSFSQLNHTNSLLFPNGKSLFLNGEISPIITT